MILDLGCGYSQFHRYLEDAIRVDIKNTKRNKNILTVQCDAHFLPFRNNVFDLVYCSHVLEHVFNPYMVLTEIKRVANGKVIIRVPSLHRSVDIVDSTHIFTWSANSFANLLRLLFPKVKTKAKFQSEMPIFIRWFIIMLFRLIGHFRSFEELEARCEK